MKKTLALLLAVAGIAAAVETPETIDGKKFNMDLVYYLNQDAYDGGDFSISFTIKQADSFSGQKSFITLAENYYIHTQTGTYVGLSLAKDADAGAAPTTTLEGGINKVTVDMSEPGSSLVHGWISKNTSGSLTDPGLNGSSYTISVVGNDTIIDMVFNPDNTSKQGHELVTLQNYKLDLNDFAITVNTAADESGARLSQITDAVVTYNGKEHNLMVPEPATATLSLLALAGLAARRKRH